MRSRPFGLPTAGLVVFCLAGLTCGGGGGSSGGPTQPPPVPTLVFTPSGAAVANSISLQSGPGGTASTLFLEVIATQVEDLYGVSFDLDFPVNLLSYVGVNEGEFLGEGGGFSTSLQAVENPTGNLVVGITRLGAVPGRSGSGEVMTMQFSAVAGGTGGFTFLNNQAFDRDGDAQAGVDWIAGSVRITR